MKALHVRPAQASPYADNVTEAMSVDNILRFFDAFDIN